MNFQQITLPGPITIETGHTFSQFQVGFHTVGNLNEQKDNVVWVCHAFSANSDVPDWWPGIVGSGRLLDPDHQFIICVNLPGSCYGTTGPLSVNPETNEPYFHTFPLFTIRDVVKIYRLVAKKLGIQNIQLLVGGSLGGQQALEWAIQEADRIEQLVVIACNAIHSPWGIAFNEAQRMAIASDATWTESKAEAGEEGMKAARAVAMLSYRNYHTFQISQAEPDNSRIEDFKAASYLQYQGEKLTRRFNAFSYMLLSKMMDSHNLGFNRESIEGALKTIAANTLVIGIRSDYLFPVNEQKFIARYIPDAEYVEIDSHYGHDGFLVETEKISICVREFMRKQMQQNQLNAAL